MAMLQRLADFKCVFRSWSRKMLTRLRARLLEFLHKDCVVFDTTESREWQRKFDQMLLEKGSLTLSGGIDEKMVEKVKGALEYWRKNEFGSVRIRMSLSGGVVKDAIQIRDMLQGYPGQVNGHVGSRVASAGVIVLQGCHVRIANSWSVFMIHHPETDRRVSYDDLVQPERLHHLLECLEYAKSQLYESLSRTGRSEEELAAQCQLATDLSAHEALAFGLIDRIQDVEYGGSSSN